MIGPALAGSPSATIPAAIRVPKKIMADWINNFISLASCISPEGESSPGLCFKRVCAVKNCCPVSDVRQHLSAGAYIPGVGNILLKGSGAAGRKTRESIGSPPRHE
jgi:hypothetical protein